jgi:hypothetical protein
MLGLTAFAARRFGLSREDEIAIVFCRSKKSLVTGIPMANVCFPRSLAWPRGAAADRLSPAAVDGMRNACPALWTSRQEAYASDRCRSNFGVRGAAAPRCGEPPLRGNHRRRGLRVAMGSATPKRRLSRRRPQNRERALLLPSGRPARRRPSIYDSTISGAIDGANIARHPATVRRELIGDGTLCLAALLAEPHALRLPCPEPRRRARPFCLRGRSGSSPDARFRRAVDDPIERPRARISTPADPRRRTDPELREDAPESLDAR